VGVSVGVAVESLGFGVESVVGEVVGFVVGVELGVGDGEGDVVFIKL
jgi:hypothetical protein